MNAPPDPRPAVDVASATPSERALYRLAEQSLAADTGSDAVATDADVAAAIGELLDAPDGAGLQSLLDHAPTVPVHRHLWRCISRLARSVADADASLGVHLFAIPMVIVAGPTTPSNARTLLSGTLPDAPALTTLLRDHGALGANQAFALGDALVSADAIDIQSLPTLLRGMRLGNANQPLAPLALAPAPIAVEAGEAAHLRFLVGTALAERNADLTAARDTGRWGMPLARALIGQLATPGVTLVALPRAALSLPAAVAQGRAARREVGASLFVSNALREFRASVGEPSAVLSAHTAADAPGGGELRLSLSSPFSPRDAQGFRCPLYAGEKVDDVATMLVELLADCRVTDIRVLGGVHADRDQITGGPLLYKPETIPPAVPGIVH